MSFDVKTVHEQEAWEHYKKIEAENYQLKNVLDKKNREIKNLKYHIRALMKFKKQVEENRKDRYRNNGKKRTKSSRTF